jgi:putative transposase
VLNKAKGASSHFVNHALSSEEPFQWQPGYGALTFAKRDLPTIVRYVQAQKEHHRDGTLKPKMERLDSE